MPFVAILGAGPLGGALAYALASRGRFDEVRLIDPEKTLAAGKALDILQSGPVDGYSTRVTGSASLEGADGAWVTVLADPVTPDPLAHLAALHRRSPGAVVVCADAGHGVVMSRAVATGAVAPDRLVGTAPAAVASAARALIALDADLSPALVHVGITAGTSPGACAVDWSRTAIDGVAAETALPRERQRRLDQRLGAALPPGPLTLAAAAAALAEAAWFGARPTFPCWWVTDGGSGAPRVEVLRFAPGGRARVATSPAADVGLASSGAGR
jgi:malate dehydrogenase